MFTGAVAFVHVSITDGRSAHMYSESNYSLTAKLWALILNTIIARRRQSLSAVAAQIFA